MHLPIYAKVRGGRAPEIEHENLPIYSHYMRHPAAGAKDTLAATGGWTRHAMVVGIRIMQYQHVCTEASTHGHRGISQTTGIGVFGVISKHWEGNIGRNLRPTSCPGAILRLLSAPLSEKAGIYEGHYAE